MKLKALAVSLLAFFAVAASAQANDAEIPGFQTSIPAHLPMVESLEPVAESYWAQRGITLPTPVEVFVIPDTPLDGAFGEELGNRIWLTEAILEGHGLTQATQLCMIYLHERGHNAGLAHGSGDPIMQADPWEGLTHVVPKCFKWAEKAGFRSASQKD